MPYRPLLQLLEDRSLLATFFVNNTAAIGPGSFKQAIVDANELPGRDDIYFNISGAGPHTIQPTEALPAITEQVEIDATTQPGYAGNPLIELNGSLAGAAADGLYVTAGNSLIRGLAINGFDHAGITFTDRHDNAVEASYIGTDVSGHFRLPNGIGVLIFSNHNRIGGSQSETRNLISGNGTGIRVLVNQRNTISGNLIGTDVTGLKAIGNGVGVSLFISDSNTIEGNVISGSRFEGIDLDTGCENNVIRGNYIGTDATGTASLPNRGRGVSIFDSNNNVIGGTIPGTGNLISGNGSGLAIVRGDSNVIRGNLIGTDISGQFAIPNVSTGISVSGSLLNTSRLNIIGGGKPGAGNVISGNGGDGIDFFRGSDNEVQGNLIGTTKDGNAPLGNGGYGIDAGETGGDFIGGTAPNVVSGNQLGGIILFFLGGYRIVGNFIGTDITGTFAIGNLGNGITIGPRTNGTLIGGTTLVGTVNTSRNVISGNAGHGIYIADSSGLGPESNLVQGNLIGTDVTGTMKLGNKRSGVAILGFASQNVIGGTLVINGVHAARNVISGNGGAGVSFQNVKASLFTDEAANVVQGNYIGVSTSGQRDLGNGGDGISVVQSVGNTIGGTELGASNLIAYNVRDGVSVNDGGGINVRENSFLTNGDLGIRLINNGNRRQAAPDLEMAFAHGAGTMISGSLRSSPETDFVLEFFSSAACDPSGFGEGEEFIGSASVTTSPGGRVRFQFVFNVAIAAGRVITATATNPQNNTSAFSVCQTVTIPPPIPNSPTRAAVAAYFSGTFRNDAPFDGTTSESRSAATDGTEVNLQHAAYLPITEKPTAPQPRPIAFNRGTVSAESRLIEKVWEEDLLRYIPEFV